VAGPLELKDLTKNFGGLMAVDVSSMTIAAGERHAVLGPNGAGKTTLFNLISGMLPPSSGRIVLFGRDVTRMPAHRRASLGLARTFQITNLFKSLSVFENVELACQARHRHRFAFHKPVTRYPDLMARVEEILTQWELQDKRKVIVSNLSYGDQRQLEVIMALAGEPRLLLLDEPTAGLSPSETAQMTRFLTGLDQSITILLIEHDMNVAFTVADRVTVMHFGSIFAQGTPEEVRENPEVLSIYLGGDRA
jgi:branched-chain amino acid transport system ATP-binding protein